MINHINNKHGIEIGGPSRIFQESIPVYQLASCVDGVNFSNSTIWEGNISEGETYKYKENKVGYQYIADGTEMPQISSEKYDFLISSDCLEHIANPLKALLEWNRILKADALMILVLPHKVQNFDRNRPDTTFEHIVQDFNQSTPENDLTHLREILSMHELDLDPAAGTFEDFTRRSLDNINNRCLHHHVFNTSLIKDMLSHTGFRVQEITENLTSFICLSIKNK